MWQKWLFLKKTTANQSGEETKNAFVTPDTSRIYFSGFGLTLWKRRLLTNMADFWDSVGWGQFGLSHHESWCMLKSLALRQNEIIEGEREKMENVIETTNTKLPSGNKPKTWLFLLPLPLKGTRNSKPKVNLKAVPHLWFYRRFDGTKKASCISKKNQPQDLITSNRSEIWSYISQRVKKATKSTNEAHITFLEQIKPIDF